MFNCFQQKNTVKIFLCFLNIGNQLIDKKRIEYEYLVLEGDKIIVSCITFSTMWERFLFPFSLSQIRTLVLMLFLFEVQTGYCIVEAYEILGWS